jgi:hypothetical protein
MSADVREGAKGRGCAGLGAARVSARRLGGIVLVVGNDRAIRCG